MIVKHSESSLHDRPNLLSKTCKRMERYLIVIDAIESKLYREPPVRHKRKLPQNICNIYILNTL